MTYQGYALLRSILKSGSDADVAKAVAYAKRIKFYPLSQAGNPPATTFVDAIDVVYRLDDSVRRALLPVARPHRADRAVADARQGHDRHAQVNRHREGQALLASPQTS